MDVIEILKGAIAEERKAQEKYRQILRSVENPSSRALLEKLIMDEESHEKSLIKELEILKRIKGHIHHAAGKR